MGKKHIKKEYPTNCIEDILFGFLVYLYDYDVGVKSFSIVP